MTQRERTLAVGAGVGGGLLLVVIVLVNWILLPLRTSNDQIDNLEIQLSRKRLDFRKKLAEKRELTRLKGLSLPADPDPHHPEFQLAWREYDKYLGDLMRGNRLKSVRVDSPRPVPWVPNRAGNKKPLYRTLTYTVEATGPLTSIVAMLKDFYDTPLLHRIRSLTIRPAKADVASRSRAAGAESRDLDVKLTVEALLMDGADKRSALRRGGELLALNGLAALVRGPAAGLALVPLAREVDRTGLVRPTPLVRLAINPEEYAYIPRKNIFYPPLVTSGPAKDPAKQRQPPKANENEFLILTDIIRSSDGKVSASLYNQYRGGRPIKLDPNDERYTSLPVLEDTENEKLLRGEIVHVDRLDIVFRVRPVSRKLKDDDNGEKIICLDEDKHLYRMKKSYWESLQEEEAIITNDEVNFVFRGKALGGEVVPSDDPRYVVFEVDEKYLDRLYAIHLEQSVASALVKPLGWSEIKAFGIKRKD